MNLVNDVLILPKLLASIFPFVLGTGLQCSGDSTLLVMGFLFQFFDQKNEGWFGDSDECFFFRDDPEALTIFAFHVSDFSSSVNVGDTCHTAHDLVAIGAVRQNEGDASHGNLLQGIR